MKVWPLKAHARRTSTRHVQVTNCSLLPVQTFPYRLNEETGFIDYDMMEANAQLYRPKLLVAGASAYTRHYDYPRMRKIADNHNAILLSDMAHISGLVAAGLPACHTCQRSRMPFVSISHDHMVLDNIC